MARSSSPRGRSLVGCSGWNYKDWRGPVYPADIPARRWFEHYATELAFDTVELNTTFYRLPDPGTVEQWAADAPDGFTFAVKLGQYCTHRKRLRDPEQWMPNHLDRAERLGPHLGPTLAQLPPRWGRDPDRLDAALALAPTRTQRWAVEVRDPSWLHEDVYAVLERHGVALCIHDLLPDHPWRLTTPAFTYVRFHGPDALNNPYRGAYTGRRLRPVAERLEAWMADGTDVYAYFNNDYEGNAVRDATWLRDRLAG